MDINPLPPPPRKAMLTFPPADRPVTPKPKMSVKTIPVPRRSEEEIAACKELAEFCGVEPHELFPDLEPEKKTQEVTK